MKKETFNLSALDTLRTEQINEALGFNAWLMKKHKNSYYSLEERSNARSDAHSGKERICLTIFLNGIMLMHL